MKCKEIKKLISKYFDGSLQESEREIVLSHINQCLDCKTEFGIFSKIYNNLPEYKEVGVSTDFEKKLFSKIEEQQRESFIIWKKLIPAVASFAVLVVFLITTVNPCKSVNTYKESYVLYPHEDIDLAELELTNFLIEH